MLRKLGKYELLEEIGHGGMATVYRGRDVNLDREVAVKVMHPHLRKTPEARARFTREARSVAKLRHPNVLEIYDYGGEDEEEAYISAELLTGPTLKDFVEKTPALPPEIAACFGILISKALAAAHEKHIVHRDVKPENVLLHEDRTAKLTDFGIAQMVDANSFTATGQILGSPGHMAPEQIEGGRIGPRTDIFSLGTVLYFMALRRLPFTGRNPHQVLKRIVDGEYPEPLRTDPRIGSRFAELIDKAMAKDPQARFETAAEVQGALESFLGELGIEEPEVLLEQFLKDPEGEAEKIRERTLARLTELAKKAAARDDRPNALRHCNRILALDDGNEEALALVESMGTASRRPKIAMAIAAVLVLGAVGAYAATRPSDPTDIPLRTDVEDAGVDAAIVPEDLGVEIDAGETEEAPVADAGRPSKLQPITSMAVIVPRGLKRQVVFRPTPENVEISVDDEPFRAYGPGFVSVELAPGTHRFRIRGECCQELDQRVHIRPDREPYYLVRSLQYQPARLIVRSNVVPAIVTVTSGGRTLARGPAGEFLRVPLGTENNQLVRLTVTAEGRGVYTDDVRLKAGELMEVQARIDSPPGDDSG
ncbi:MAG: protein kinase [Deltaproteobacteria bacterium]|nr:protein kinase [Deltaproteobacteria bacterium]